MIKEKGVVIHPDEISETWVQTLLSSDIRLLGLHPVGGENSFRRVAELMERGIEESGASRLRRLTENGIGLEYEMHAMSLLLPREEFSAHPEWFRMDEKGNRTPDFNGCASDENGLERISRSAEAIARVLPPTTHRYNLWLDDVKGKICHCERCRNLSASDQALKICNAVLRGLRRADPLAQEAYLAYLGSEKIPEKITPEEGIYLEFAPIERNHHLPIYEGENRSNAENAEKLIAFFGRKNARVLEYWLDNSKFSGWKKPPKYFELDRQTAEKDLVFYEKLGFETVTTFACYLGEDYEALYPFPDLSGYACFRDGSVR